MRQRQRHGDAEAVVFHRRRQPCARARREREPNRLRTTHDAAAQVEAGHHEKRRGEIHREKDFVGHQTGACAEQDRGNPGGRAAEPVTREEKRENDQPRVKHPLQEARAHGAPVPARAVRVVLVGPEKNRRVGHDLRGLVDEDVVDVGKQRRLVEIARMQRRHARDAAERHRVLVEARVAAPAQALDAGEKRQRQSQKQYAVGPRNPPP